MARRKYPCGENLPEFQVQRPGVTRSEALNEVLVFLPTAVMVSNTHGVCLPVQGGGLGGPTRKKVDTQEGLPWGQALSFLV